VLGVRSWSVSASGIVANMCPSGSAPKPDEVSDLVSAQAATNHRPYTAWLSESRESCLTPWRDGAVPSRSWLNLGFPTATRPGIPHNWNIWIIYPRVMLGAICSIDAWSTFGRRPITEADIQREIDRINGTDRSCGRPIRRARRTSRRVLVAA
jgi:hypothetical protein